MASVHTARLDGERFRVSGSVRVSSKRRRGEGLADVRTRQVSRTCAGVVGIAGQDEEPGRGRCLRLRGDRSARGAGSERNVERVPSDR